MTKEFKASPQARGAHRDLELLCDETSNLSTLLFYSTFWYVDYQILISDLVRTP